MTASVAVEEVLLLLKIAFLVLLYLFIWRIVRAASRDLRTPQESFVLAPWQRPATVSDQPVPPARLGRLVVISSTSLRTGATYTVGPGVLTVGRGTQNDLPLPDDQFASADHARFEPSAGTVRVVDTGSTNGTFVNGDRLDGPRRLEPGDVVRVGETDLRFER